MNLCLVKELGDRAAQGRAYGNLGNTHYLLGNFVEAIDQVPSSGKKSRCANSGLKKHTWMVFIL